MNTGFGKLARILEYKPGQNLDEIPDMCDSTFPDLFPHLTRYYSGTIHWNSRKSLTVDSVYPDEML